MRRRNATPRGGDHIRCDTAGAGRQGARHDRGGETRGAKSYEDGHARAKRGKGRLSLIAGIAILLIGLGLLLYPAVTAAVAQRDVDEALAAWRSGTVDGADASDAPTEGDADGGASSDQETFRSKEGDAAYQKLLDYNEAVRNGTGDKINDPFAFSGEDLAELGLPDAIIGSLEIPRLNETIPLYLGATTDHLSKGAGVIAGTSMPTGGEGNNCVIAAHRGAWAGLTMFRDITEIQVGDTITITTPWDKLTYRAAEMRVISPDDAEALAPQPGRDLVTLFTCHPYGHNYQRYLVFCERVPNEEAQSGGGSAAVVASRLLPVWDEGSPLLNLESVLRLIGLGILLATGVFLVVDSVRRRRRAQRDAAEPVLAPPFPHDEDPGGSEDADAPASGLHFKGRG